MSLESYGRAASRLGAVALVLVMLGCGGGSNNNSPGGPSGGNPTPTPTPTPTPEPTPTPTPEPDVTGKCDGLADGPVTRVALTPRSQREGGGQEYVDMRVRARPGYDEVWCVDQAKAQILDFNINQKNESGQECCWQDDPFVSVLEDPEDIIDSTTQPQEHGFIVRLRTPGKGRSGTVEVQVELDGVASYPWQSGGFYPHEPIRVVFMSAQRIKEECPCVFEGNGRYSGENCSR